MKLNLNLFELNTIYNLLDYEISNTDGHSDEDYERMISLKERVIKAIYEAKSNE